MEVKLIVVGGANSGQEIPVTGSRFFIGRVEDCHLRPKSDLVSRHHAVILAEEGFVAIRDFGSKNGTLVNGERIRTERELKSGDRLKIGPLEFEARLSVAVGGKKKPKVHSIQEAAARTVEAAAAGKSDDDELDIGDWLGAEAAESTAVTHSTDTQPFGPADLAADPPAAAAEPAAEEPPEQEKKKKPRPVRPTGFQPGQGVNAPNSQSAADETLRKLFGGR